MGAARPLESSLRFALEDHYRSCTVDLMLRQGPARVTECS